MQRIYLDSNATTEPAPEVVDAVARAAPGFGDAVLLDVTYAPWPTTLARSWHGPVARGADLLLWQATEQVRLMTGREAPVGAMREALEGYPQS